MRRLVMEAKPLPRPSSAWKRSDFSAVMTKVKGQSPTRADRGNCTAPGGSSGQQQRGPAAETHTSKTERDGGKCFHGLWRDPAGDPTSALSGLEHLATELLTSRVELWFAVGEPTSEKEFQLARSSAQVQMTRRLIVALNSMKSSFMK